jgi:hypothetical protein
MISTSHVQTLLKERLTTYAMLFSYYCLLQQHAVFDPALLM